MAPVFSGRCSFLPGRNRIFFGSVSPHCCLLDHRTDWGYIIFRLEFFSLLFSLLLNQDCIVEKKGKDFLGLFLEHEMVDVSCEPVSAAVDKVTKSKVILIQ